MEPKTFRLQEMIITTPTKLYPAILGIHNDIVSSLVGKITEKAVCKSVF